MMFTDVAAALDNATLADRLVYLSNNIRFCSPEYREALLKEAARRLNKKEKG